MDTIENFTLKYNVDRKAASRLLKVSVRTIDRYIKKKSLTAQNIGGRVWLNKEEVRTLVEDKNMAPIDMGMDMSTPVSSIDATDDMREEITQMLSTSQTRGFVKSPGESQMFQKLYEDTMESLNEKQSRLEIANYRVGQLEAQLKNSIPLLEYHRESSERKLEKAHLLEKMEYAEKQLKAFANKLKFENYNKKVLLTILLILLALQPLWLLFLAGGK